VWTGQEALDQHLVDHLGGLREALDEARRLGHLPADAPIVELPRQEPTLLDVALKLVGLGQSKTLVDAVPVQIKDIARAVAPFAIYDPDVALARIPWAEVGGSW
jgi:protease-4